MVLRLINQIAAFVTTLLFKLSLWKVELIEQYTLYTMAISPWPCLFLEVSILWSFIPCYPQNFHSLLKSMITSNINFVLIKACCREAQACTVDSRSSSMRNRLQNVLGGCVRHTRTIFSFPRYCLGLRTIQEVFFAVLHYHIAGKFGRELNLVVW